MGKKLLDSKVDIVFKNIMTKNCPESKFALINFINAFNVDDIANRAIFYSSKMLTNQASRGLSYANLNKATAINIYNFTFFKEKRLADIYDTSFTYGDINHKIELSDIVKIHIIELTKLHKILKKALKDVDSLTDKEAWTIFLAYAPSDDYRSLIEEIKEKKEGLKEGLKKGRIKAMEDLALNLIKENVDIKIIKKTTGFSKEKINELKRRI